MIYRSASYHLSPLRYPGGKSGMYSFLDNVISQINSRTRTYVEPYAGGAGAALALLFNEKVEQIHINDLDKNIYAFWYSILNFSSDFISLIENSKLNIETWYEQKEKLNNENTSIIERGFALFYLNRANRSGIIQAGPIGGKLQNGHWKIDARFNRPDLVRRIKQIGGYTGRIILSNSDGIQVISQYKDDKNSFLYVDPPYVNKGADLYMNHYLKHDHELLGKCLNRNRYLNWILTYDDSEIIRHIYKKRKIIDFSFFYHTALPRVGSELLIFSDKLKKICLS